MVNKMLVYLYQPSKLYSNTFVWISEKIFIIQNNQDGLGKYFRISKWSLSRHWQTRVSQNQKIVIFEWSQASVIQVLYKCNSSIIQV